jgi:indole-3-glycerol phosphate synthase
MPSRHGHPLHTSSTIFWHSIKKNSGAYRLQVKRASPSKGDIALNADARAQALSYARGGASAISVLTEPTFFKGQLADMCAVRAALEHMYALGVDPPGDARCCMPC